MTLKEILINKESLIKLLLEEYEDYSPEAIQGDYVDDPIIGESGYSILYFDVYKSQWTPNKKEAVLGKVFKDISDQYQTSR